MLKLALAIAATLFLVSCSPSQSSVETAIAQTQEAAPTATTIPEPSATSEPTATPTLTPSPSPTPDVRVIDADPQDMFLALSELPLEGKYYLGSMTPNRNSEVIAFRGIEAGTKYIEETGRIDGWIVEFLRGTRLARVPEYVDLNPIIFLHADGPTYLLAEDGGPCNPQDGDYTTLQDDLSLGHESALCLWKKMQPGGQNYVEYFIPVRYRNVYFGVYGGGFEDTFDPEWVIALAQAQLEKIQQLPLADEVTFTP